MNIKLIVLAPLLLIAIPQSVHALSPKPLGETLAEPARAAQLQSAPELMECSLDRSRALWQFPNPVRLGDVPCQYLDSVGGPEGGEGLIYPPGQLESAATSMEVDRASISRRRITQPLDSYAPMPTTRGQWIDLSPESVRQENIRWIRDIF